MAELFRYIEQAFVVPAPTESIDVSAQSDLQTNLLSAISEQRPPDQIRSIASDFLLKHFSSPVADPFQLGRQYRSLGSQLLALKSPEKTAVDHVISNLFGSPSGKLVVSKPFLSDKALLNDALVGVKLLTAFDRANAADLVTMRRAVAFVDDFAAGKLTDMTMASIKTTLQRPVRIPRHLYRR